MWPDLMPPPGMLAGVLAQPNAPMMPDIGMPQTAPQAPAPKPSLWQRITARLMPVPQGFEGVLSPADIDKARRQGMLALGASMLESSGPTLGPPVSLGQAVGRGLLASGSAFNNVLENAKKINQFAEERRLAQEDRQNAQRMESEREKVMLQVMQGVDNNNPADVARRLNAALPELLRIGDTKGYAALSGYLASVGPGLFNEKPEARDIRTVVTGAGPGAELVFYDNDTGLEIRREQLRLKGDTPGGADLIRQARMDRLSAQFEREVSSSVAGQQQIAAALETPPEVAASNSMAQLQVVNAFARAMDDRTGVRDQERQQIIDMAPLYQKAKLFLQRNARGESVLLPARELNQMYALLKMRNAAYARYISEKRNKFIGQAKAGADDVESYFYSPPAEVEPGPLGPGQPMVVPGAAPTIRRYVPPGR